jgi:hypothetical protein
VDGELAEDRANDVGVEDVGLRALFGEAFDGLEKTESVLVADGWERVGEEMGTFAREMDRKQTDINMPLMVTWPSPNLMPER